MRLGLYTFAALTLIALIGAFVYTLELGTYRLELLNISLPISVWVILPALLLFLFTVVHMLFYGTKNYFQLKKWTRDSEHLENALYWSLANEPKEEKYVMPEIKSSASLLSKASLTMSDNVEGLSPRLARLANYIQKIKNGEYIDLKENKLSKVFNDGNPILIQNRLNRLESDDKFVEDVMRATTSYSKAVQAEALRIFASKVDFVQARKYAKVFDVENFMVMLNRINQDDNLNLSSDILTEFVDALELKCADYIKIAVITKKYFKPEENLLLFREYQAKDEKAQNAYLYLLFEYELLDQVSTYLDEHEEDDFIKFRALYTLKKEHNGYQLEDIIDIDSLCQTNKLY
jgi:hypothetical protein